MGTVLVIWDIQTGGVAKEVEFGAVSNTLLVWSLDGRAIGILTSAVDRIGHTYTVHAHDVYLGTARSSSKFQSVCVPYVWAHNESFRIMTAGWDGEAHTIRSEERRVGKECQ